MDIETEMKSYWKPYIDTKHALEALPKAHARFFARCVQLQCARSADDKEYREMTVSLAATTLGILLETLGFGFN